MSNNLYVKNFPKKHDEEGQEQVFSDDDLRKLFEPHGEIVSAVVMKDEEGKSKGFGFVCFKDSHDAKKALEAFSDNDRSEASHGSDRLYVVEARSKEQRQMDLQKSTYRFKMSMMYLNLIVKNIDPTTTEEEFQ